MSKNEPIPPHETFDFSKFVTELDRGQINDHLTFTLSEVIDAVKETNLTGEMTVKFVVKKEGERAIVAVEMKKKVPEHPMHGTLFHFGNGGLVRDDPRQMKLKGLDKPTLKTVDGEE